MYMYFTAFSKKVSIHDVPGASQGTHVLRRRTRNFFSTFLGMVSLTVRTLFCSPLFRASTLKKKTYQVKNMFNCLDIENNKFLTSPWLLSNDFSCNFQVVLRNVSGCVTRRKGCGLGPRGGASNLSV